jgi:hydroxylysine kinase
MSSADVISHFLGQPAPVIPLIEAQRLASTYFGLNVAAKQLSGERDCNFHLKNDQGDEFVLKVIHSGEDRLVTDFQSKALVHIADVDPTLPTPRLIKPIKTHGYEAERLLSDQSVQRIRCVTYLSGKPLRQTQPSREQYRAVGSLLAKLDLALVDFRHPAQNHDLLWDLKRADRVSSLLAALPDTNRRSLSEQALHRFATDVMPIIPQLRSQVIHNDFNPHNILAAEESDQEIVGIIDFGDMVWAPLVQDLATAAAYQISPNGHPLEGPAEMIAAFHAISPLLAIEVKLLPQLIATRMALTIAISSWRASRCPENADYLMRNQASIWHGFERLNSIPPEEAGSHIANRIGMELPS